MPCNINNKRYNVIKIPGTHNQCYARTTLFVILFYINRSPKIFNEWIKYVNNTFEQFKKLNREYTKKNKKANNRNSYLLINFDIKKDDKFKLNNKEYSIYKFEYKNNKEPNNFTNLSNLIIVYIEEKKIPSKEKKILCLDYISNTNIEKISAKERISQNKENKKREKKIETKINNYFKNKETKQKTIQTFIDIYHNSKLFNNEKYNKILRNYLKMQLIKIRYNNGQLETGNNLNAFEKNFNVLYKSKPLYVFITKLRDNIKLLENLVYLNCSYGSQAISITAKKNNNKKIIKIENMLLYMVIIIIKNVLLQKNLLKY